MKLYGAIDLHSTNNVTVVIDEQDRVVYQKRLPNGDLALAVKANLSVMSSADEQTEILERTVTQRVKLSPQFCFLKTVSQGFGVVPEY